PYGQHYSPYLAMSNNPVSFVDPDGGYDYNYTNSNLSPEEINWIEREKRLNREWDATLGRGKNPMTVGLGDGVSVGADGNPFGGPAMNALILKYTSTKRVHTPYDLGWGVTGSTFRNETIVDWAALKNDPAYKALIAPQTHSQHSSPRTSGQTISQGKPFDTQSVRSTSQFSLFNDPLVSKVKSANDIISSSFGLFAAGYKLESWGTPAKYAQRFNGLVESAKSISITRVDKAIRLGTHLTKLNTGLTLLGTSYSASKVINAFVHGGVEAINKWDAIDTMVGVAGLAGPSLVTLGLVSNPVGWGIGAGAAIYGISRFLYDYNNPD
ncbi:MAG: hypothetical protein KDC00_11145, partial [Flavobacteriales bacterium]|nr:hypothetical protein [Flavobacteriales bacterium]